MIKLISKCVKYPVLALVLLMLLSEGARATCKFMSDSQYNANDSVSLNFGKIIVQRDAPIGSTVAEITEPTLASRHDFIVCDNLQFTTQWAAGSHSPVDYGGETLYQSGITGLAWRIITPGAGSTTGRYGTGPLPRQLSGVACVSGSVQYLCGGTWGRFRIQLVKIASTTGSGPLSTGTIGKALIVGDTNIFNYIIGSGSVQTVACSVTNRNILVNMPQAKKKDFSGTGSTSGETDFAIHLNCDNETNINLTINVGSSGAADASNGILNLDNASTDTSASGIGIQILYGSAPFQLGKMLKIATTNADGTYALPLQARYYQTEPSVTPGKTEAGATFTMTYQ
ncbi:fimbrial protein [Erwinia tasmaniensis]|uniref:fimbrial protein n=1 Tax=Erwinia tasmaniensis TaxID=338565 RepID=UPI003A4DC97B